MTSTLTEVGDSGLLYEWSSYDLSDRDNSRTLLYPHAKFTPCNFLALQSSQCVSLDNRILTSSNHLYLESSIQLRKSLALERVRCLCGIKPSPQL